MANDLQTMFEQLGPGAGAVEMAAQNMAADKDAASQQAYRQAQMADIMQRTAAAKDMAPLELEAKRTSNDVSKLKAAADRADYRSELVGRMIPLVENAPPAARLALMKQYAEENGLPMDESHLQHFAKIPADKLPEYLRTQRDNDIKNSEKYRQAWDVAEMQRKSAEKIASGHDAATLKAAQTRADVSTNKGQMSMATLTKLSPDKRYGVLAAALASNKNPVTDADMSPEERSQWQSMADSDLAVLNANYSSRQQQGVTVQIDPVTKKPILANKTPPTLGNAPAAVPAQRKPLSAY